MSVRGRQQLDGSLSGDDPHHAAPDIARSKSTKSFVSQGGQDYLPGQSQTSAAHPIQSPTDNQQAPAKFTEDFQSTNATEVGDDNASYHSAPHREHSTLKKKGSVVRKQSLKRSGSRTRRSSIGQYDSDNHNSAFFSPVPAHSNPTEILANRFSAWRRILKDFIAYFREVSSSFEAKSKNTSRLYQALNNAVQPEMFLRNGGILETNAVLKEYHKSAMVANEQARQIDTEIISALTGLRSDLSVKIKEIKGLSGDFKNSLDKEREGTRRAVVQLEESLSAVDTNPSLVAGKNDPYVIKLAVDRQLRRQLTEENYLHRAYLNLEGSGRELESIVVSEIQKAFESYVRILRREGMELIDTAERLETQTVGLPGDHEWTSFVERDPNFVDPSLKIRAFDDIEYPGYNHPAVTEVRAGLLERKSKYLKSYTPGWYALSPSHLHEFKTPDRNHDLTPVMSLYLPDSSMGSHTPSTSNSHKFMIKGRQTGGMHRGHSWVFRAESHEAMMGFYEDIKKLTDLSGAERNAFVASHARKPSSASQRDNRDSSSENGLDNDEADDVPYSAERSALVGSQASVHEVRPEGGRFPSDLAIDRLRAPRSATSGESDRSVVAAGALHESDRKEHEEIADVQEAIHENPVHDELAPEAAERPRYHQRSNSAFSYDERHPVTSTHVEGEDFTPVGAEISPAVEKSMYKTTDPGEVSYQTPVRRDSTASWTRKTPSRKPTATYGFDPVTGLPDPAVTQSSPEQSTVYSTLDRQTLQHAGVMHSTVVPEETADTQNSTASQFVEPSTSSKQDHDINSGIGSTPLLEAGTGTLAGAGGVKAYDHYQSKEKQPKGPDPGSPTSLEQHQRSSSTAPISFLNEGSSAPSQAVVNASAGRSNDLVSNSINLPPKTNEENSSRELLPAAGITTPFHDTKPSHTEAPTNSIPSENVPLVPVSSNLPVTNQQHVNTYANALVGSDITTALVGGAIPTSAGPPAVSRPTKNYGDLASARSEVSSVFPGTSPPVAQRTNSSFTISELHVPGEYPKGQEGS